MQILRLKALLDQAERGSGAAGNVLSPTRADVAELATSPTEISYTRPNARPLIAGFTKIFHPAALGGVAGATMAWYGLRRLRVGHVAAQFNLTGLYFDCRSPRTADVAGVGQPKGWATAGGHDAFIVVGRNLTFLTIGGWTRWHEPGIVAGVNEVGGESPVDDRIISAMTFPGGSFADATPTAGTVVREFGLEAFTFKQNDSLDVALCVLASKVSSGNATNYIDGYAKLELKLSTAFRARSFDK